MNLGRTDYDVIIQDHSIPSDEPRFLLRAQDDLGHQTVRLWAGLAQRAGVPAAVVEQALAQADAMEAWHIKKLPDDGHLTPEQSLRLAYNLTRRIWDRGNGEPYGIVLMTPVPMVLHCPSCGLQHIDESDAASGWTNPPHRSHLCREMDGGCGHIWRPADIPTRGVLTTLTIGIGDSPRIQRREP